MVLKCLYLARIGKPYFLWSVNKLASAVTKWTKACGRRLARLTSYIHHTSDYRQCCHVVTRLSIVDWVYFKTQTLRATLKILNQSREESYVYSEAEHFVPISWMCKKQTSVSHSSTGSEIISLDARLRLDGIHALDLWDLIVSVLGNTPQNHDRTGRPVVSTGEICSPPHTIHKRKQSQRVINDLDNVDFIPSNVQSSHQKALLYVFEDNEAVIKMIIKGRSLTMSHVSRTHRVALDRLFDRINLDPKSKSNTLTPKTNSQKY